MTDRFFARVAPIFQFFWIVASLEDRHYRALWSPANPLLAAGDVLLLLAAVPVLLRPERRPTFAFFCLVSAANTLWAWPVLGNDSLVILAVNVLLLGAILRKGEGYLADVAGPSLLVLAVTYGMAAFHKLNAGFFDPEQSCVLSFLAVPGHWLGAFPRSALPYLAALTVGTEAALPALLLQPRTRALGLLIGTFFHLLVGLSIDTFSSVVLCLYLLLLPPTAAAEAIERAGGRARTWRLLPVAFLAWVYWAGRNGEPYPQWVATRVTWFAGALAAVALVASALRRRRPLVFPPLSFGSLRPVTIVVVVSLFLNALGPYAGFRSTLAFAMFSNLRVEAVSNHWLVRKGAMQFSGEVDNLATILWSDIPELQPYVVQRWRIPRLALAQILDRERALGHDAPTFVRYEGRADWIFPTRPGPFALDRYPFWKAKLLSFHPVPPERINPCQW